MEKKFYFVGGPLGKTSRILEGFGEEGKQLYQHMEVDPICIFDPTAVPRASDCSGTIHTYCVQMLYHSAYRRQYLMVHSSVPEHAIGDILRSYGWFQ